MMRLHDTYLSKEANLGDMARTTVTLSDPLMETLKVYAARTKKSMHAQSEVIEEALQEYFAKRNVMIEGQQKSD